MIHRRRLLAGSLAVVAIASIRQTQAAAEIEKNPYVAWAYGSGENWWPTSHFAIYSSPAEARVLKRRSGAIRVRVPYWTTNERSGFIISGAPDNGFNGDGYSFGRGRFSVFVPGPRRPAITLRITMAHTNRDGRVTHFVGHGPPGQRIRLRPERPLPGW